MSGTDRENSGATALPQNDSLTAIRFVLVSLRRRRGLAILVFLLTLGLGFVYAAMHAPRYTATALILVEPKAQRVVDSKDVIAEIGADTNAVESQVALLRSAAVSPEILEKFAVYTDPEYNRPSLLASVLSLISPVGASEVATGKDAAGGTGAGGTGAYDRTRRSRAVQAFERNLKVKRREKTYILEVSFTSTDPVKAANVANEVAAHYLRSTSERRREASREAASWLDRRIAGLRAQAEASDRAVTEFKASHGIVDLGTRQQGTTLRREEINRLNDHVNTARAETAKQKARYQQVLAAARGSGKSEDLPEVLTSTTIGSLRIILTNLKLSEIRALRTLGERHPRIAVIREEIRTVRGQIDAEIKRILAGAKSSYEAAKANQASLEADLRKLRDDYARASGQQVRLQELERNAAADRKVLEQYLGRLKETTQQASLSKPDAQIVSTARIPIDADLPGTALILVVATLAGFVLALGAAVLTNTPEYRAVTA